MKPFHSYLARNTKAQSPFDSWQHANDGGDESESYSIDRQDYSQDEPPVTTRNMLDANGTSGGGRFATNANNDYDNNNNGMREYSSRSGLVLPWWLVFVGSALIATISVLATLLVQEIIKRTSH